MTTITTTITWTDLQTAYNTELSEYREGYEDAKAFIEDEWGDDAFEQPVPQKPDAADDDDLQQLMLARMAALQYEESAKTIQKRNNALDVLAAECDGDEFEIQMLSGTQLMNVETELQMMADARGVEKGVVENQRKGLIVDKATVDAPERVPTDDDGSPTPSDAGNPLTLALYEAVESLNQSGQVDFRAPGFGEDTHTPPSESSGRQTPAAHSSEAFETEPKGTPDDDTPDSGSDSSQK